MRPEQARRPRLRLTLQSAGNGPIDAFIDGLGQDITPMDFHEHAIGTNARSASYIELRVNDGLIRFGVGIDGNIVTASFKAVVSALNRHMSIAGRDEIEKTAITA